MLFDLKQQIKENNIDKTITHMRINNFLIDKKDDFVDKKNLLNGLFLVGDYLEKTILKPNNLNQPISRLNFINTLK